jgi:hypothetical protein
MCVLWYLWQFVLKKYELWLLIFLVTERAFDSKGPLSVIYNSASSLPAIDMLPDILELRFAHMCWELCIVRSPWTLTAVLCHSVIAMQPAGNWEGKVGSRLLASCHQDLSAFKCVTTVSWYWVAIALLEWEIIQLWLLVKLVSYSSVSVNFGKIVLINLVWLEK